MRLAAPLLFIPLLRITYYICVMRCSRNILITLSALLFCSALHCSPVFQRRVVIRQPDGSSFTAVINGDEHLKTIVTDDGKPVGKDLDGWWKYCSYDSNGTKRISSARVGGECTVPTDIPYAELSRKAGTMLSSRRYGIMRPSESDTGNQLHRTIVIPVQFSDVEFTYTEADINRFLNINPQSVRLYFLEQFLRDTDFTFTLTSTVTLSREAAYYGENDETGQDSGAAEMICEACMLADEKVDFSLYDHIFIMYAGKDEADGAGDNCVWSHTARLSDKGMVLRLDGRDIDLYSCTSELNLKGDGEFRMAGIGRFCHEFGHNLGLYDMYDTTFGYGSRYYYSAGMWAFTSLMDRGCSNNDGETPPNLNAVEREILGIGKAQKFAKGYQYLSPVQRAGLFFRLDSDKEDEYFLVECREASGWDAFIAGEGVLIYHIDRSEADAGWSDYHRKNLTAARRWALNEVNGCPHHQCAAVVAADGRPPKKPVTQTISPEEIPGIFYGTEWNSFSPYSPGAYRSWSGWTGEIQLSDIRIADNRAANILVSGNRTEISSIQTFQDEIRVKWVSEGSTRCSVFLDGKQVGKEIIPCESGEFAFVFNGLEPDKGYGISIVAEDGYTVMEEVETKAYSPNNLPFIYMNDLKTDSAGYAVKGCSIPLKVYNAPGLPVRWTVNGFPVSLNMDYTYTIRESCTIRAYVSLAEGGEYILEKEIQAR